MGEGAEHDLEHSPPHAGIERGGDDGRSRFCARLIEQCPISRLRTEQGLSSAAIALDELIERRHQRMKRHQTVETCAAGEQDRRSLIPGARCPMGDQASLADAAIALDNHEPDAAGSHLG